MKGGRSSLNKAETDGEINSLPYGAGSGAILSPCAWTI